jgi:predicted nucleic acid-binding protein
VKAIADTGFLVAFASERDRYHGWAVRLAAQISEPLLTYEAVLAETAFHLKDVEITLALVRNGMIRLAFDVASEQTALGNLAERYADRSPDLADLCLIRMSELYPRHSVITVDVGNFCVYRRNKRDVIPLIHPPGL